MDVRGGEQGDNGGFVSGYGDERAEGEAHGKRCLRYIWDRIVRLSLERRIPRIDDGESGIESCLSRYEFKVAINEHCARWRPVKYESRVII